MSDVSTRVGIIPEVIGGAGARNELAELWRSFKEGKLSVEEFNNEMRNTSGAIYAHRRAVMLMRTEYRNQRTALYEAMRGFRAIARIGRTITSVYQTYTLMQIRVADKTRDIRDVSEDLADVEVRRKRVVADLGSTNAIALRLMAEEDRLTRRLTDDKRELKRAQDQNLIGYVGIGLQMFQIIPTMVSLKRHLDLTRLYLGEDWSYAGLQGIVSAAGAARVSILGAKVALSSLASLAAIPIAAYLTLEIRRQLMETEYWEQPVPGVDPGLPGPGMAPGFRLDKYLGDWWESLIERSEEFTGPGLPGPAARPGFNLFKPFSSRVNTEGEDIDIQVDIMVTQTGENDGESRHR